MGTSRVRSKRARCSPTSRALPTRTRPTQASTPSRPVTAKPRPSRSRPPVPEPVWEPGLTGRSGDGLARARRPGHGLRVLLEEPHPLAGLLVLLDAALADRGVPGVVVVEGRAEHEEVDQRRAEEQLLQAVERPEPDQVAEAGDRVVA